MISAVPYKKYRPRKWFKLSNDSEYLIENINKSIRKWEKAVEILEYVKEGLEPTEEDLDDLQSIINSCGMCYAFHTSWSMKDTIIPTKKHKCHKCPLFVDKKSCYWNEPYRETFLTLDEVDGVYELLDDRDILENTIKYGEELVQYLKEFKEYLGCEDSG